jgi:hypothetical protein
LVESNKDGKLEIDPERREKYEELSIDYLLKLLPLNSFLGEIKNSCIQ